MTQGLSAPETASTHGAAVGGKRRSSRRILQLGTALGVAFFLGVLLFFPRATFLIERADILTTPCDPTSHTYKVTASMSIRNTGTVAGTTGVNLLYDGKVLASGQFEVPVHASVDRGLDGTAPDCQWHRFSVELFIPASPSP